MNYVQFSLFKWIIQNMKITKMRGHGAPPARRHCLTQNTSPTNWLTLLTLVGGRSAPPLGFSAVTFFLITFLLHNKPRQLLFWCITNYGKLWKDGYSTSLKTPSPSSCPAPTPSEHVTSLKTPSPPSCPAPTPTSCPAHCTSCICPVEQREDECWRGAECRYREHNGCDYFHRDQREFELNR